MEKHILTSGYVSLDTILDIDRPAQIGFTSIVKNHDNSNLYIGGCPVNIAAILGKLGVAVMPMIRAGSDYQISGLKKFLEDSHVMTDGVQIAKEAKTARCYLVENEEGEHITLFYQGAQGKEFFRPMEKKFFENAAYGILTVGNECDNVDFFKKCCEHKVPMIFGMKADFDAFPEETLKEILYESEIIFTNRSEKEEIEKRLHLNCITDLYHTGKAKIILTTHGGDGSEFYDFRGKTVTHGHVSAIKPKKMVDCTGAGDSYMAGFVYGLLRGYDTEMCCKLGSAAASFVLEKRGCCTNLPTREMLLKRVNGGDIL